MRYLPVSANPAMAAIGIRQIVGRPIFVERDIAEQTCAGIASFKKIVAQDEIIRKPLVETTAECLNVVDTFTDE